MDQRSEEWHMARSGLATASEFITILTKGRAKGDISKVRQKYAIALAAERITGIPNPSFTSRPTTWGIEQEPLARTAYELHTGCFVDQVGFVRHSSLLAGCSPDMFVDEDGGGEIKCPYNSDIHLSTILHGMPKEHKPQVQGTLWITGREWYDFVSFDSRQPLGLQLYVERQCRDEEFIKNLEIEVEIFLQEVSRIEAKLKTRAKKMEIKSNKEKQEVKDEVAIETPLVESISVPAEVNKIAKRPILIKNDVAESITKRAEPLMLALARRDAEAFRKKYSDLPGIIFVMQEIDSFLTATAEPETAKA